MSSTPPLSHSPTPNPKTSHMKGNTMDCQQLTMQYNKQYNKRELYLTQAHVLLHFPTKKPSWPHWLRIT